MPFEGFLKIDGVTGESKRSGHEDEIEILSLDFGIDLPRAHDVHAGSVTGSPSFSAVRVEKYLDSSSPVLYHACAKGKVHPKAVITLRRPGEGQLDYYKVEMQNVYVTTIQITGQADSTEVRPTEHVELSFSHVTWTYTKHGIDGRAQGDVSTEFDLEQLT